MNIPLRLAIAATAILPLAGCLAYTDARPAQPSSSVVVQPSPTVVPAPSSGTVVVQPQP